MITYLWIWAVFATAWAIMSEYRLCRDLLELVLVTVAIAAAGIVAGVFVGSFFF